MFGNPAHDFPKGSLEIACGVESFGLFQALFH